MEFNVNGLQELMQSKEMKEQLASVISAVSEMQTNVNDSIEGDLHIQQKNIPGKESELLRALMPYLKPSKQIRLERAMKIANITKLAQKAISSGGIFTQTEEVTNV